MYRRYKESVRGILQEIPTTDHHQSLEFAAKSTRLQRRVDNFWKILDLKGSDTICKVDLTHKYMDSLEL
jgi:hypothetical protein